MKSLNFHSIIQKFSLTHKGEFRTIAEKSAHDWKQMVLAFALLCSVVIGGGLYLFIRIVEGDLFVVPATDQGVIKAINQSELDATTEYFNQRKTELSNLEAGSSGVDDPSL